MTPFIIFSLARSGSTSLAAAINMCHENTCMIEPFSPDSNLYYRDLALSNGLPCALDAIHQKSPGIKHVWHPAGWPFPNRRLNEELLFTKNSNLVLLIRNNILRRVVSGEIAAQSRIWHLNDENTAITRYSHVYKPLNLLLISQMIEKEAALLNDIRARLLTNHSRWMQVHFEDLFGPRQPSELNVATLRSVFAFLGLSSPPDNNLCDFLSAGKPWVSSALYHCVPGMKTIEERLGSATTGYLFQ